MQKDKPYDIHERIFNYVIDGLKIIKLVPRSSENLIIVQQVTKSLTSMGANDQEADGTDSARDFVSKYAIVRKEGKETNYWWRVIYETNPELQLKMKDIMQEGKELVKIVTTIIVNTKKKK